MKIVAYFEGRQETEEEQAVLLEYGEIEIDPAYNFHTYLLEIKSFASVFKVCRKLNLTCFKTYLPEVNGDFPIVVFSLATKIKME